MIDPRKITPLLSNMTVDREIGRGPNGVAYLVTRRLDGKKMVLKHISIPASDAETKALIYAGAVSGEADAQRYYASLVKDIKSELLLLNGIKNASNILKFRGYQVDQKFIGSGYDVYLLADFCRSLPAYIAAHPLTKLQAVNLAIDLCSGLEQLRAAGLVHKDIRPTNIYLGDNRHFLLGDLGVVKMTDLEYSSMPDQLLTDYSAPEVVPSDASLSATMDIYSVGMILYEIYNGGLLPMGDNDRFVRTDGELPAPAYADIALSDIILRACAFDPENRYQTPGEMKQALVEYMNANAIPIPDSIFLNAFKSLLWAKENVNSILDIVDYFSEEQNAGVAEVRSSVWRRMMCVLTENEAPDADAFVGMKGSEKPNRYLLLSSLVEYLRQHLQCISFPLHTGLLHRSLRVMFCLLSMRRIRSVSATNCLM